MIRDCRTSETVEFVQAVAALHTIADGFTIPTAYREAAKTAITVLQAIDRDRNEWRTQHENLLSVRRSDLAILDAALARERALREALRERAVGRVDYGNVKPSHMECDQCKSRWSVELPERHAPGCLCELPKL